MSTNLGHLKSKNENACQMTCCVQCIARDVDGKREVAGVHWDYDCYGAPGKMAQVCALLLTNLGVIFIMLKPTP